MRVQFVQKENQPEKLVCEAEVLFEDNGPLTGMKLVGFSLWRAPDGEVQWFFTRVFGSARPRLKLERLPLTEAILDVTRAGVGVAVMSEWIALPHLTKGDLVAKRLATGPLRRPWRIAWRAEAAEAAARLFPALEATIPHARLVG